MSDGWLVLGAVATIGSALVAAVAQAGPKEVRLALDPNVPRVVASASVTGDDLTVTVDHAPAGARVAATTERLACTGSGTAAGGAVTDAAGAARWAIRGAVTGPVRDGRHVLAVAVGGTTIACGPIPSLRPAATPARQRHWGIWSFARHFID